MLKHVPSLWLNGHQPEFLLGKVYPARFFSAHCAQPLPRSQSTSIGNNCAICAHSALILEFFSQLLQLVENSLAPVLQKCYFLALFTVRGTVCTSLNCALTTNNDAHFAQMAIKHLLLQPLSFAPLLFLHTIFIFFSRKSQAPYSHRPKLSAAVQLPTRKKRSHPPKAYICPFPFARCQGDDMLLRIPKAGRLYLSIRTQLFFTSSVLFQIEATARWRTLVVTQQ